MEISIILPVYNGKKYLEEGINSLINQTFGFENLEIVIVDHHSTDNTKDIVMSLAQKYSNITPIFLPKNTTHTPGYPRNLAMSKASGKYLMFMDQDDLYKRDMVETLYNEIKKNNSDFVGCRYELLINDTEIQESRNFSNNQKIATDYIKKFPELISTAANMTIWNKIFEKRFLEENNITFFNYELLDDIDFMLKSFTKSRNFVVLNDYAGYIHRVRRNKDISTSNSPSKENLKNFMEGLIKIDDSKVAIKYNYDVDCKPLINEVLIQWIILFFKNDLDHKDQYNLLKRVKPLYKNYKFNTRLINISLPLNIFINIFFKIFTINTNFSIFLVKLYRIFNINSLVNRIFYK